MSRREFLSHRRQSAIISGTAGTVQLPRPAAQQPAGECLLAFCGQGAKGRAAACGWAREAGFAMQSHAACRPRSWRLPSTWHGSLSPGFRYRLRDPMVIRLRLGGGDGRL
jgi:hypothetical protein